MKSFQLSRRTVLKGAGGITVGLPVLEAMLDSSGQAYAQGGPTPKRYVLMFMGGGTGADHREPPSSLYLPRTTGRNYDLEGSVALAPIAGVKDDVTVVSGLRIPYATGGAPAPAGGWSGIFHGCQQSIVLTGMRSAGERVRTSTTDQLVAEVQARPEHKTPLSMCVQALGYLGSESTAAAMSFRKTPTGLVRAQGNTSPAGLWNMMFNDSKFAGMKQDDPGFVRQLAKQKSVLDLVKGRRDMLAARLGSTDRAILGEHFEKIRNLEQQLTAAPELLAACRQPAKPADPPLGLDTGGDFRRQEFDGNKGWSDETTRGRLMCELLAMALLCDFARVATLQMTYFQSSLSVAHMPGVIGKQNDVHSFAHGNGMGPPGTAEGSGAWNHAQVVAWHVGFFARLVELLRKDRDAGGTVLDNTAIVFLHEGGWGYDANTNAGDGLGSDSTHSSENMVCLVGGGRGLGLKTGQHISLVGDPGKETRQAALETERPFSLHSHPVRVLISAMKAVDYFDKASVPEKMGDVEGHLPELFA